MLGLKKKFIRGILIFVIGIITAEIGLRVTDPNTYGATDPTTMGGLITILGSIMVLIGAVLFTYDISKLGWKIVLKGTKYERYIK